MNPLHLYHYFPSAAFPSNFFDISPSGCLGLLDPLHSSLRYVLHDLTPESCFLTQSSNHCLSSHVAFSPLLTLVDPRGSSSGPVCFSALVNLFIQLIPGRLLPSWSVTWHNNESPCSESLLTFLLMATCPKDLLLSQVSD